MKTSTCISSAPVMPAVWPQSEHIRPVKRRLPNTVDEPKNIGYYLESLRGIASRPDREVMYNHKIFQLCFFNQFIR